MAKVLIVEDTYLVTKALEHQFKRHCPWVETAFVVDATNAKRALTGEKFWEFHPKNGQISVRGATIYDAVIWNNQIPEDWEESPKEGLGLETARAMYVSEEVNAMARSHFIMHSANAQDKFLDEKIFAEILPKPIDMKRLVELFRQWGFDPQRGPQA